jgi:beta-mannosidase
MKKIVSFLLMISTFVGTSQVNTIETISIASGWQMHETTSNKWIPAIVPGCVHSDLLRNKLIPEPYYRTNEKDLQWIDKKDWEYKTTFEITDKQFNSSNLELVFKGLDTYADVFLNGKLLLKSDNMFREWVIDAKPELKKGKNELRIYFHSPIQKGLELLKNYGFKLMAINDQTITGGLAKDEIVSPFIRKAPYHFGWDWGPRFVTSGIWQPVYIKCWNSVKMNDLFVQQQFLSDKLAKLNAQIEITSENNQMAGIEIMVNNKLFKKQEVKLNKGKNLINIPLEISNPKRWWSNGLGEAYLYKVSAVVSSGKLTDELTHNIGLRSLKLIQKPDDKGHSFYFELNGIPVFAKGANHIPNDMFLDKVTNDVYDWEVDTAVQSNMNMLRVWGGGIYENHYFYEQCDRKGILVWQDFMFACSMYPGDKAFLESVKYEAEYQVKRLRNHPSIALWCGNNEIDTFWKNYSNEVKGWRIQYTSEQRTQLWKAYEDIFKKILPEMVSSFDPKTPYWHSSPTSILEKEHADNTNPNGDVHYWGVWWGKQPFEKYNDNIGRFMSEYGFQSFPDLETVRKYALPEDYDIESEVMRHHQRSTIGNVTIKDYMDKYYRKPLNFENFLYVGQVLQAYGIRYAIEAHRRAMSYNMGSLMWQINDCWPVASWSSCDYYKRWKALQYELKRSFEPVIITGFEDKGRTAITIISDKLKPISGTLEIEIQDFSAKLIKKQSIPVNVAANTSVKVFETATTELTNAIDSNYVLIKFLSEGKEIARKVYFFTQPKNLTLQKPAIQSKITQKGDVIFIELRTNTLAKDVFLNFEGDEGFFEDNYFDLLPGETKTITYKLKNKKTPKSKLKVISLIDSYQQ